MNTYLGVDIGSATAKMSLIDENGKIIYLDIQKKTGNPRVVINSLLVELRKYFSLDRITAAAISGTGRGVIPKEFGWAEYSSSLAIASGIISHHPGARTIIEIGGQSSQVISIEDGLRKPWKVASNPLCAAGTGRFLEQQAYRLGINMDDFAKLALKCSDKPPRIAARCSVFAKTDLIHLQQKGIPVETMLYALCEGIARMIASLKKGSFEEPVHFVGGVAANNAIVKALNAVLSARNKYPLEVRVPDNYVYTQALGSALLSRGRCSKVDLLPQTDTFQSYFKLPGLKNVTVPGNGTVRAINGSAAGYLGVDIGSTSTKAVLIDDSGKEILAKNYLMTSGRPIDAVKKVFSNLLQDGAGKIDICGVGVTGSGRYLIGSLIGADLIKNEITAQTRAAAEVDSNADIIEIGGQDSKLIIKRNGIVVDYQMNKACAAGTGSFIDELAEMLGISVKSGEFAELAFSAPHTFDLGTRCAAFMSQAVASAQQEGTSLQVITASLANSIAKNYLSKVVGTRKLGTDIILTGAVFYNKAVVSAFHQLLEEKNLTVADHREVSGAIGAALLAKETIGGKKTNFRGLQKVIDGSYDISTFTCCNCDNNCAITRMKTSEKQITFYGSRCDRYDSAISYKKEKNSFDDREDLLFRDYKKGKGSGPSVGIPRALLVYDYAPMLIGFLNELDARVLFSGKTSKEIIEQAAELSYSDSCFPLKLLHAHIAGLDSADYILYPSFIRMGIKDGEENQKYTCPLIQASPFIVSRALCLGDRLLIPTIDFSYGDNETIKNLTGLAKRMGFSRRKGRQAALAGIEAQHRFEAARMTLGQKLLELRQSDKTGVVILARSYLSQDSGANLGIVEKLAQLGVAPIPLDFLPLDSINPRQYSDSPYWSYEGKFIAAAAIIASNPQLYGLVLTNFGCGPNSFILKILEDIMGDKPLGQIEIDEHAAEAGIATRLEAFVDTIRGHARSNKRVTSAKDIYRGLPALINNNRTLLIPRMAPHAEVVAAAMQAFGKRAIALPEPDERNILYSNRVTSGTECLPYRATLGDFIKYCYDDGGSLKDAEGFVSGSYGPCRLGKYALEHAQTLKNIGFNLPIRTSVSNNAYRDLNLGIAFERLAWSGIVAVDHLQKLLWRNRPYEKQEGTADIIFDECMAKLVSRMRKKEPLGTLLRLASSEFASFVDPELPPRPLVGINGEIYLRSNRFCNNDLVRVCEQAGLEVSVSPIGEWFNYTSFRNLEDAVKNRKIKKVITSYLSKRVQEHDEKRVAGFFGNKVAGEEPSTKELLAKANQYLSSSCGTEAVLSIGSGIHWMENPGFDGVISVMPHGCMPGGIVAAMTDSFSTTYQKPWTSLTFDGFHESNNLARVSEFTEIVKFCRQGPENSCLQPFAETEKAELQISGAK